MNTSVEQMARQATAAVINEFYFPEGMIGFSQHKQFSISRERSKEPFLWIQSLSNPDISFIIIEPAQFRSDYVPRLSENDKLVLQITDEAECQFFAIVYVPKESDHISANLLAPIAVNKKAHIGKQVVLQEQDYQVQHFILEEMLKKAG